jgi:hypothetical protein
MRWRHLTGRVATFVRSVAWWVMIAPFCWASDLPALGIVPTRRFTLSAESDGYPVTELLGRLGWFRSRLRLTRSVLILLRASLLCGMLLVVAKGLQVLTREPQSPWLPLVLFLIAGWAIHLAMHHAISPFDVARFVDRRMDLRAQVATAVELSVKSRLDQPLVRTQVRVATNRLRDLEPRQTIPFVLPGRDAQALGVVVVAYAIVTFVGTLGIDLPQRLAPIDAELAKQASQEVQAPSPYVTMDGSLAPLQAAAAPAPNPQTANGQLAEQLNSLRQQLQSQQITSQQYQEQLKQVQQQVEAQASQSLAAQDALNALAAALKDASSTNAISDSLSRGDYKAASDQLNQLSQQLGQLSPEAKTQIADRLAAASQQTQRTSQPISHDAGQASQALKQGNTQQASQSIQSLAQSVQQASQQIEQQSQLGQELQDVQQQLGNKQNADTSQSDSQSNGSADQANPSDSSSSSSSGQDPLQAERAAATGGASSASDNPGGTGNPDGTGSQAATRSSSSQIQSDQSGANGGVGSTPGSSPLGGGANPLDVHGIPLTIIGKSSQQGPSSTQAGDRSVPLTGAGGSTLNGLAGSGNVPSNVPINVHQENNVVPLDRKPVVREFFTDAGQ